MIIEAKAMEEASQIADSHEHDVYTTEEERKYFDFGDGMTASKVQSVTEISQDQMEFLEFVGLADRI